MRTDSDRYMSAYADPNPAHKTRNRVLIISAHPGLKVSGLLRIISVPDKRFRISLSYYPILGTLVRLRLGNLPVASPFSSSTDLIAHTLFTVRHVTLFTRCFIVAYFPGSVSFPTAYSVVFVAYRHPMVRVYHLR